MSKYIIENSIDFYKHLYETDNDASSENICLISGTPLQENYVKLKCGHSFNYESLYNDIFNQRYKQYQTPNIYYTNTCTGIICPYCRHEHNDFLPYYPDLPFKLIYGINTNDAYYKIAKIFNNNSSIVYLNTLSYFIGKCNYADLETNTQCKNIHVILHEPTCKTYCNCHIFAVKKQHKIQEKLIAKQKIKEQKELIKNQLKAEKIKQQETLPEEKCNYIFKKGISKGAICGCKSIQNNLCKKHVKQ